jgi:hypothetical protein
VWLLPSPDLTPLYFSLLGVYREKVQNVNELRDRIVRAAECVTSEVLAITWREGEHHFDGAHFEIS